ncbi:hypothetical protein WMY93_033147 [Mugilogobius chulae]|uniref:Uncharacterized protein n=1 Tax=Mugilogobius chulae TaxID=88201 RepID=A0AAW0MNQ9_9GOBI
MIPARRGSEDRHRDCCWSQPRTDPGKGLPRVTAANRTRSTGATAGHSLGQNQRTLEFCENVLRFGRRQQFNDLLPHLAFASDQHRFVFPPGYVHVILLHLAEKLSLSGKQQLQLFAPGHLSCFVVILHIIPVLYESPNLGLGNRPAKRKSGGLESSFGIPSLVN